MKISAVRLYHPAPWGWLYSYQAALITLRIFEVSFIAIRYLFFRAPLLVIWTRLPGLRDIRSPYRGLGEVLAPTMVRPSLVLGANQMGTGFAEAQGISDMEELRSGVLGEVKPPSRFWSVMGCVIRGLFTDLGPTYVKFGQIVSMRSEVPPTIKRELQLLQDKVPPMSRKEVKGILERELGRPVEEVFEWVEEKPIAAASLAQVQRAKLRREGKEVALKVRRQYLEGAVMLDTIIVCDIFFGMIKLLLPLLNKQTDLGLFGTSYRQSLEEEIDLVLERRNQEKFRTLVMNHPIYRQSAYVAEVYPEYCTTKLIVMELVKNYHRLDRLVDELTPEQLMEFASTRIEGLPPEQSLQIVIAQMALMIESLCHWNFGHGDFHLGNLYALEPDKSDENRLTWKIFLCDFGMMTELTSVADKLIVQHAVAALFYYRQPDVFVKVFSQADPGVLSNTKQKTGIHDAVARVYKKYIPYSEQAEVVHMTINPRSPTTVGDELLYAMATKGIKEFSPVFWLFLKNFSYAGSMTTTMSVNIDVTDVIRCHQVKFIKDWVMAEVDELDIADLRTYTPEKLRILRHDDRKLVLKALASEKTVIKPGESSYFHDYGSQISHNTHKRGWRDDDLQETQGRA